MAIWCNAFKWLIQHFGFFLSILVIFQLTNNHPPPNTHTHTPRNWARDKLPSLVSITLWYLAFNRHTESNHSCIHVIIITIVLMMMEYMISVVFHSYVFCVWCIYTHFRDGSFHIFDEKLSQESRKKLDRLYPSNVHQTNWFEHYHTKKAI